MYNMPYTIICYCYLIILLTFNIYFYLTVFNYILHINNDVCHILLINTYSILIT